MSPRRIQPDIVKRMAHAVHALFESLNPSQQQQITMDFEGAARTDWHYIPRERPGLALKQMDTTQRQLALTLVSTGLSAAGHQTVLTIMELETVLAQLEGDGRRFPRDPALYYLSLFGPIATDQPWGWRLEGHHVSINHTIVEGRWLASTPLFFGSNPAEIRHGEREGFRALAAEEDLARDLLHELDGEQQRQAIVLSDAPGDILTTNVIQVGDEIAIEGLLGQDMSAAQRQLLEALVHVYISRLPDAVAVQEMERVQESDLSKACFVWAGSTRRGEGHYYRVQGDCFVAEYDNTQNDANHIHAVWRDLQDDFGRGLLSQHYREGH